MEDVVIIVLWHLQWVVEQMKCILDKGFKIQLLKQIWIPDFFSSSEHTCVHSNHIVLNQEDKISCVQWVSRQILTLNFFQMTNMNELGFPTSKLFGPNLFQTVSSHNLLVSTFASQLLITQDWSTIHKLREENSFFLVGKWQRFEDAP